MAINDPYRSQRMQSNTNGIKLKDPDIRWEAYMDLCAWLARGKSIHSFTFKKHGVMCTAKTLLSYMKDESEFPTIHRDCAESEGYSFWEQVVEDSAIGKNKDANTASLQMLMRNKFKWDKKEETPEHRHETDMDKVINHLGNNGLQPETDRQLQPKQCEDQSVGGCGPFGKDLCLPVEIPKGN